MVVITSFLVDFNSRTGLSCAVDYDTEKVPDLVSILIERDILQFCKTYDFIIVNSRTEVDRNIGDFTFISATGCSVGNYFKISESISSQSENFKIDANVEKDHLLIND